MAAINSMTGLLFRSLIVWAVALPGLRSPLFYPDADATLVTGVSSMVAIVLELLAPASK